MPLPRRDSDVGRVYGMASSWESKMALVRWPDFGHTPAIRTKYGLSMWFLMRSSNEAGSRITGRRQVVSLANCPSLVYESSGCLPAMTQPRSAN